MTKLVKYKIGDCFRVYGKYSDIVGFIKLTDIEDGIESFLPSGFARLFYLATTDDGLYAGWYSEGELNRAHMLNRLEKLVLFGEATDED